MDLDVHVQMSQTGLHLSNKSLSQILRKHLDEIVLKSGFSNQTAIIDILSGPTSFSCYFLYFI